MLLDGGVCRRSHQSEIKGWALTGLERLCCRHDCKGVKLGLVFLIRRSREKDAEPGERKPGRLNRDCCNAEQSRAIDALRCNADQGNTDRACTGRRDQAEATRRELDCESRPW